ncbi:glycosyltransferase [Dehalobacter sp. CF]|uniref:glycosyltransferase n=1 Tax=Dehalobacter sp. CF TaxID=1131462 RepID=UPI00028AFAB3|nr:glycosyltransferase [Dehalobacter sp. CF]AFV05139.1 Glycosyltransferase [Dehalobacter sp. CF]
MKEASNSHKILIVNNNLNTGGVQKSLVNLLNEIKDKYEITLFLFSNSGQNVSSLPNKIRVIEAPPLLKLLGKTQDETKKMGILFYILRAILVVYSKVFSNHLPIRLLISTQKTITGFDTAISFLQNEDEHILYGGCNEFVIYRTEAKQKITFMHCDFSNYGGNTPKNRKIYKRFDKIAVVSENCKASLSNTLPRVSNKTICVYNCQDYTDILNRANIDTVHYPKDHLNIVTVARLSKEKGILRGIDVIDRLVQKGYLINWHIVGDGKQKLIIMDKISQKELTQNIYLHGNQENPYCYVKNADALFLPSFHEAAPMVIDEAKILNVPIITTNTVSAYEMVLDGKEGFICENSDSGLYEVLKQVLDYPHKLQHCKEYMRNQVYTNSKALSQFQSLIEEGII